MIKVTFYNERPGKPFYRVKAQGESLEPVTEAVETFLETAYLGLKKFNGEDQWEAKTGGPLTSLYDLEIERPARRENIAIIRALCLTLKDLSEKAPEAVQVGIKSDRPGRGRQLREGEDNND